MVHSWSISEQAWFASVMILHLAPFLKVKWPMKHLVLLGPPPTQLSFHICQLIIKYITWIHRLYGSHWWAIPSYTWWCHGSSFKGLPSWLLGLAYGTWLLISMGSSNSFWRQCLQSRVSCTCISALVDVVRIFLVVVSLFVPLVSWL